MQVLFSVSVNEMHGCDMVYITLYLEKTAYGNKKLQNIVALTEMKT